MKAMSIGFGMFAIIVLSISFLAPSNLLIKENVLNHINLTITLLSVTALIACISLPTFTYLISKDLKKAEHEFKKELSEEQSKVKQFIHEEKKRLNELEAKWEDQTKKKIDKYINFFTTEQDLLRQKENINKSQELYEIREKIINNSEKFKSLIKTEHDSFKSICDKYIKNFKNEIENNRNDYLLYINSEKTKIKNNYFKTNFKISNLGMKLWASLCSSDKYKIDKSSDAVDIQNMLTTYNKLILSYNQMLSSNDTDKFEGLGYIEEICEDGFIPKSTTLKLIIDLIDMKHFPSDEGFEEKIKSIKLKLEKDHIDLRKISGFNYKETMI
ncbi:MAG: hypothetical protein HF978_08070 [Desulfobacteraceae bacterium]|nr:hypothetical protein [Desulfobacteraceae bacterium]MBC2755485.1 hypothetical protein [Desulfobacteraceae bacterium]